MLSIDKIKYLCIIHNKDYINRRWPSAKQARFHRTLFWSLRSSGAFTISLLYPVIYRLEEQGHVEVVRNEVVDGRARSYYGITQQGRDYLKETLEEYELISKVFGDLMKGGEAYGL